GLIAIVATGMIYLSYLLGNIAILLARLRGWLTKGAPFKLGGWGLVVNLLGLAWGGSMLVNFLWPRPASNPSFNTILNPTGAAGCPPRDGTGTGAYLLIMSTTWRSKFACLARCVNSPGGRPSSRSMPGTCRRRSMS